MWWMPAALATTLEGDRLRLSWGEHGAWGDETVEEGLAVEHDGVWVDYSWAGTPWSFYALSWTGAETTYAWAWSLGHDGLEGPLQTDLSAGSSLEMEHAWSHEELELVIDERWEEADAALVVSVAVHALADVGELRFFWNLDPDQDYDSARDYRSLTDSLDLDGDGAADWVEAAGPDSGHTVGIGRCDEATVGALDTWPDYSPAPPLADLDGATEDAAIGILTAARDLAAGESWITSFVVAIGDDAAAARDAYAAAAAGCDGCDDDGDGGIDPACSGDDCDDADPSVHAGAVETWYDGVDQDCAGDDDFDQDGDGHALDADCDDEDPASHPGATETWYDGVDQDCAGDDDFDQDGDGWGTEDCDDADATVYPGAEDTWYDGVDQDCAGNDDLDQDGDGYEWTVDCDDLDPALHPGASETWYDGVDQDCAGDDDFDQDGDGAGLTSDCDDEDPEVHPEATETWYDGVDQDCAGDDDFDQDGDGSVLEHDCDDTDPEVWPGTAERWYDGVDQDCLGDDDYDQDRDGLRADVDCDDGDPEVGACPEAEPGCGCGGGAASPAALLALLALRRRR